MLNQADEAADVPAQRLFVAHGEPPSWRTHSGLSSAKCLRANRLEPKRAKIWRPPRPPTAIEAQASSNIRHGQNAFAVWMERLSPMTAAAFLGVHYTVDRVYVWQASSQTHVWGHGTYG